MNNEQFERFMQLQNGALREIVKSFQNVQVQQQQQQPAGQQQNLQMAANSTASSVPLPPPLELSGDMEENFEFFSTNWKNYASAMGMDEWPVDHDKQKTSILLSVIGSAALKKYFNFGLTDAQRLSPDVALQAIKAKVVRERNKIVDWFEFFSLMQQPVELIDDYVARLKSLAKLCKFGALEEDLIVYKIVTSNKWQKLRAKMLTMPNLTEVKVVDLCRAEEIAEKHASAMGACSVEVNMVKKKHFKCKYCGDRHEFAKGVCPALGKKCNVCGGKNHFAKVCKLDRKQKGKSRRKVKKVQEESCDSDDTESVNSDNGESESSSDEAVIGKVYDFSESGGNVLADVELFIGGKWKIVQCELDTGANTSLVGIDWIKGMAGCDQLQLLPSKFRLQSFGGGTIPVLGEVRLPCKRRNRKYTLALQVVDVPHKPLLSAKVCKTLGFIKFCNSVSITSPPSEEHLLNVYRIKAQQIVDQHSNIFEGYGKFPGVVSLEVDPDVTPSIQQPRRVPIAMRDKLKKELRKLEQDGLIIKETQHTDWVSNIVLVRRGGIESDSIRICLDPIPLNKALKRPNLQFTTIDEILPELGKAKVFSTVDAKKGFWHVVLDHPSSLLTTFWTPFGRYRWTRLPFGIAPAPEIFQMKLQEVIQDLEGVECIADDILIFGTGDNLQEALESHNGCLERLLIRLEENNVKLNRNKLKLCMTSVKFYGHVLTTRGLQPDESKVETIKNFPRPQDKKELQRFVGMVNYLSRFIPNLSSNFAVLRRLISDKEPWVWDNKEEEEFARIKSLVADTRSLQYYDVTQPLIIECDASSFGLGTAVFQSHGVIGYASRTLTSTERNYAQIEKELLAILFSCIRFDQLIVGNPKTIVRTDHKPLVNVFQKPLLSAPKRLQHMLLSLQRYNLEIQFVKGKENVVADAISRAPLDEGRPEDQFNKRNIYQVFRQLEDVNPSKFLKITDERLTEVIQETAKDPSMQQIIRYIRDGWPVSADKVPDGVKVFFKHRDELSHQDGIVFRNDRVVVPYHLRRKLTEKVHISHNGVEGTLKLACANLFWPGMTTQIKDAVARCEVCAKYAASQPVPPMQSVAIPVHPFQLVSMDVFFADYQGEKRKFLVTVDHYSDFFEVDLLKSLTPNSTITVCKKNFSRHGKPQLVITDNGTNFVNKEWRLFATEWEFQHSTSAPYHQQANGKSEAAVKIAKRLLKKSEESGVDFWYALLHWRNIPNKIGSSPAARLFSRSTRCGLPTSLENLMPKPVQNVPNSIEDARRKTKFHYDKAARKLPALEAGSPVYVQLHPETTKHWIPGTVTNRMNDRSYLVNVDGAVYRRDLVNLKPRKEPDMPVQPSSSAKQSNIPEDVSTGAVVEVQPSVPDDVVVNQPSTEMTELPIGLDTMEIPMQQPTRTPSKPDYPSPRVPKKNDRPKREIRLPSKLKDYDLN